MTGGVHAVERSLSILDAFIAAGASCGLADLARATGLVKPTVLRNLVSLEKMGYVARLGDGRYKLGPRCLQLGAVYRNSFRLEEHVLPVLQRLAATTRESATFHIREGDRRLALFRVESPQAVRDVSPAPSLVPLDTTSTSRVLSTAAWNAEPGAGEQRVHASAAVHDPQTASLSTAVFGAGGVLVGALTISGPIGRIGPGERRAIAHGLGQAARRLSAVLGAPVVVAVPRLRLLGPGTREEVVEDVAAAS